MEKIIVKQYFVRLSYFISFNLNFDFIDNFVNFEINFDKINDFKDYWEIDFIEYCFKPNYFAYIVVHIKAP